jgi:sugar lactone lactonase YvrE
MVFLSFTAVSFSHTLADDDRHQFPKNVHFTTRAITPFAIEGLTMDATGNFYTTGRAPAGQKCPVWRIGPKGQRKTVGFIPTGCGASGITFDSLGNLYIADSASGGVVRKVKPDPVGCASDDSTDPLCSSIPDSTNYATGVPGTNGLAFDRNDNLWTGDGVTGLGRVWKIAPGGGVCEPSFTGCVEAFRIQAMANDINPPVVVTVPAFTIANVGSDRRSLPGGTIGTIGTSLRTATNTGNSQPLVANGVAFNNEGDLFVADTARGAIWKVEIDKKGNIKSPMGTCDTTFSANTLCLDNVFVQHPLLEGADGIALDEKGNIWVDANERNAVIVVSKKGEVTEIFRNPVNSLGLRNSADTALGNATILEFPTSPFLLKKQFCTANSDGGRRDNFPQSGGEINAGAAFASPDPGNRGKISCMDEELKIPGVPLPVH